MDKSVDSIIASTLKKEIEKLMCIMKSEGVTDDKAKALIMDLFNVSANRIFSNSPALSGVTEEERQQILHAAISAYNGGESNEELDI